MIDRRNKIFIKLYTFMRILSIIIQVLFAVISIKNFCSFKQLWEQSFSDSVFEDENKNKIAGKVYFSCNARKHIRDE